MTDATQLDPANQYKPPRNQWLDVWDQFKKHRGALIGAIVFLGIVLGVFAGPLFWRQDAQFVPPVVEMIKLRDMCPSGVPS